MTIHALTLDAITAVVRRHYLRPVSLDPVIGDPDKWRVVVNGRIADTEVFLADGRYTFTDKPTRKVPRWNREIENETH